MVYTKKMRFMGLIILSFWVLFLAGCGQILNRPAENESQGNDRKNPPKSLATMEENTQKIIDNIQKIKDQRAQMLRSQKDTLPWEPQGDGEDQQRKEGQAEEQSKKQQDEKQGKNEQEGRQENNGHKARKSDNSSQKTPNVNWIDMESTIETIHRQWNIFEPKARKDGASQDLTNSFEKQLNSLTDEIIAQSEDKTLAAANNLYRHFSDFYNLYKHQTPPEAKKVIFHIRQIIILGEQDKWKEVDVHLEEMDNAWETTKARMNKPDRDLNEKIDLALNDFKLAAQQKNLHLTKLKGNILIENINEIK